jgi:hypothetical protein
MLTLCDDLETQARQGTLANAQPIFHALEVEAGRVCLALEAEKTRTSLKVNPEANRSQQ